MSTKDLEEEEESDVSSCFYNNSSVSSMGVNIAGSTVAPCVLCTWYFEPNFCPAYEVVSVDF